MRYIELANRSLPCYTITNHDGGFPFGEGMAVMTRITDPRITSAVERFFGKPAVHDSLELLGRRLSAEARLFVAGGAIRNLIIEALHGSAPPTLDIDLFVGGVGGDVDLVGVLNDQTVTETDLKGVRWHPASSAYAFDLCLLPDFLVIARYHLDPTLENLLAGIDFTINAVVFDVGRRTLIENGATAAIRERVIDFNSRWIPDRCLKAYRILLMAHKTGFRLSEAVFEFVTKRMDVESLKRVKRMLRAKQGKAVAAVVMLGYDHLCRLGSYASYRAHEASISRWSGRSMTGKD